MKLTTTVLALLPLICDARPSIQRRSETLPWDYKLEFQKAKHYLQPDRPTIHHEKRQHVPPIEQGSSFQFLPPPYNPDETHLKSPYPLSGVSTFGDSGRAQMLDNMLPDMGFWGSCPPAGLNCDKCPRDARCVVHTYDSTSTNYPYPDSSVPSTYDGPPEFKGGEGTCPLHTCKPTHDLNSAWACGKNAKCARGHCVCKTGFKGADRHGRSVRGFDDLSKTTVWVDIGMDCDVPCDSLSCAEVKQEEKCFQRIEDGVVVPTGTGAPSEHVDVLETSQTGGGATQVPGVVG
jgi:hypothetical protein